jgi:hypothetical protein
MMHDYCKQLDADKNLSGEQKSRLLAEFQRNTFVLGGVDGLG